MKRLVPRTALAAALAALALAASAAPASATAEHTIDLAGQPTASVGQPMIFGIAGRVAPAEEWWDLSWIEVVALPGSLGICPADAGSAGAIAEQAGVILAIALRPNADSLGGYYNSVAFTPRGPDAFLICGYLYNEVGYTWARDEVSYSGGGGGPAGGPGTGTATGTSAAPVNVSPPWVSRAGRKLVCHPGSWSNAGRTFAYRWMLDSRVTRVTGARPYAPPHSRGHSVRCRVTASGPGGQTTAISRPLRLR